ncbi:MAG: type I secretion C-terminal target domain-containing protein [Rhodospirillales bacterium]|nr:MAG: type I secretion C-terminal target domain-containing protein [Rhodospirillales bacterium]
MATDGTDIIFFTGTLQQITVTLVNPYSSKSYDVDEEFRVNSSAYDGLGGTDFLFMTDDGDFLSLTDNVGMQVVHNIEQFFASNGGDVINLADANTTYGDVIILGGAGDDILWANIGNDQIFGSYGNDIIDGGPGNDILNGNDDNDQIFGGQGDDRLDGGAGDDILYGGTDLGLMDLDKDFIDNITFPELIEGTNIQSLIPPGTPALGINSDNLTVSYDASATLTFRDGFAGYNNTLGIYSITADGTIEMASVLWANVKDAGINIDHQIELPVGEAGGQFGFFIIADGDRVNSEYLGLDITGDNVISFVYDYGGVNERAATINDDGNLVSVVYNDGTTEQVLNGYHYHTTPRGDSPDINWDGDTHAVSGLLDLANQNVLRIGFEDLPNLGDADYEDVLFDLDIDRIRVDASEQGSDTLIGGLGNDILYGEGGDDVLFIGEGFDQAYGGTGSDTFVMLLPDALADKIFDFEAGVGGDILNIADILVGYSTVDDALSDFVQLVQNGSDTELHINADGDIGGTFEAIAVFDGGLNATLADLIADGNIEAETSIPV